MSTASSTASTASPTTGAGSTANGGTAGGTGTTPAAAPATVNLTRFDGVASRELPLRLGGSVNLASPGNAGLMVEVWVAQNVDSRAKLDAARANPTKLSYTWAQLGERVPVVGGAFAFDQKLSITKTGLTIYPMKVRVVSTTGGRVTELGATYTFLVWAPAQPLSSTSASATTLAPTAVTTVLPISSKPRLRSDGLLTDNDLAGEIATGGRLDRLLTAVDQASDQPFSIALALDPTLLKALTVMENASGYQYASPSGVRRSDKSDEAAKVLAALRRFAGTPGNVVFALPWGDADITALLHADQAHDARLAVTNGRMVVAQILGDTVENDIKAAYPVDGLADKQTLAFLSDQAIGMSTVILDDQLLPAVRATPTPTALTVQQSTNPVRALAADSRLAALVTAPRNDQAGPSVDQSLADVRAELAMITAEQPSKSRLAVLALPRDWDPPVDFAKRVLGLVAAPAAADAGYQPFVEPVRLPTGPVDPAAGSDGASGAGTGGTTTGDTAAATATTTPAGSARGGLIYPEWAAAVEIPTGYVDAVEHLRDEAATLTPVLCDQVVRVANVNTVRKLDTCDLYAAVVEPMKNTLMTALSVWWRSDRDGADRRAGAVQLSQEVDGRTNSIRNSIQITASEKVTLTSREGTVPLTVQNMLEDGEPNAYPMTVILSLSSNDQTRLSSPAQVPLTIEPGAKAQVEVKLSSDSAGTFPVYVQVLTPDGEKLTSQPARILVRSTAYGSIATAITYAAVGLFAAAVVLRLVRRARRRGRGDASGQTTPGGGEPPSAMTGVTSAGPEATPSADRATTPVRRIQPNAAGAQRTEAERAYAGGVPANPSEP
ncbi:hypothetical protein I6A84_23720 [Frankia sp. CNm7]|uniref:Glycoprotein n=1 Tax=Frankia nepalensis TaxID=1836974 RepID=A0A937RLA3_9ACTN|nr:DUF6049 family protein [Frankia nepalensis]MBL7496757.1 hypothetical protein [Frankia nepalensis]MBL7510421.1 hypothetical protein [Frankia nepalensis]MBL7521015.1 hypothetical protein [Frankia nepalensis]MBL7630985.1 hypothetical protein [Frankia nepalensis]